MKRNFTDNSPEAVHSRKIDSIRIVGSLAATAATIAEKQIVGNPTMDRILPWVSIASHLQVFGPLIRSTLSVGTWDIRQQTFSLPDQGE